MLFWISMDARKRQSGWKRFISMAALFAAISALVWLYNPVGRGQAAVPEARACGKAKTVATFKAFLRAYDKGDSSALDRLIADEPDFQWYSSGPPGKRSGHRAFNRRTLGRYFKSRHAVRDQMRIRRIDFNGRSGTYSNFGFELRRRVNGFREGEWFLVPGKGAISCYGRHARLIVFSLGAPRAQPRSGWAGAFTMAS